MNVEQLFFSVAVHASKLTRLLQTILTCTLINVIIWIYCAALLTFLVFCVSLTEQQQECLFMYKHVDVLILSVAFVV